MKKHSETPPDWEEQRNRIIGLGETSIRKSYYPELQQRIKELERKNEELNAAYEEQTATEEELRQQFEETLGKEKELRASEERFRSLIAASPVPIMLARDGVFIYANPAFCRMTGYDTPEELMGKNLIDLVTPEHRATVAGLVGARTAGDPAATHYEAVGIRRDGSRFPYEITIAVISLTDGPVTMAFVTDTTERKAAEAALAKSSSSLKRAELIAGTGHWEFHRDSHNVYASDGARSIYGLTGEKWSIADVQKIALPEYRSVLDEALRALINEKKPYDVEFRILRPTDGRVLDIHSIAEYDEKTRIVFGVIQDITERKRADAELHKREEQLHTLINALPDIVCFKDGEGRWLEANRFDLDLFQISGVDYCGKKDAELALFSPFYRDAFLACEGSDEITWKQGSISRGEETIPRPDGTTKTFDIIKVPLFNEDGSRRGLVVVGRDVTERRAAEAALRQNEAFLTSIVENIPMMLFVKDAQELKFVRFNKAGEALLGYTRDLLLGKSDHDFFPKEQADFFTGKDRQVLEGKVPVDIPEEKIETKARGIRLLHTTKIPILTETGESRYLLGISEDITEKKAAERALRLSEERYRTLVDITDTGYLVLDSAGKVIDANDVYVRLTGRVSLQDIKGRPVTEWTAPHDLERNAREVALCLERGFVRGLEIDYLRPDGTIQPVEINASVFHGESRDIVLTICRDIADRKRTNVALQQARNKLNLLNAVTFQDIRTAAFSLSAYQELVKTLISDPKARSHIEKQELFLKKMTDTLEFARNYQEMGIHPARWQNVRQVFLFAISHLDFLHMKQNVAFDNLEIFADPLFEKALYNIMDNVLRYGEKATEVAIQYEERPNNLLLIITDNGIGIPSEEKNMIFDRGYGKGSGLGLFLVREVLSITGMTIRENGVFGKGLRMEIEVPQGAFRFTQPLT
ncbi:MAG: PAS domain S-box protein [Methanomicrobiales archaeon]|nr:PAS domain S-box protein [Methanomicrobiales archaeon]